MSFLLSAVSVFHICLVKVPASRGEKPMGKPCEGAHLSPVKKTGPGIAERTMNRGCREVGVGKNEGRQASRQAGGGPAPGSDLSDLGGTAGGAAHSQKPGPGLVCQESMEYGPASSLRWMFNVGGLKKVTWGEGKAAELGVHRSGQKFRLEFPPSRACYCFWCVSVGRSPLWNPVDFFCFSLCVRAPPASLRSFSLSFSNKNTHIPTNINRAHAPQPPLLLWEAIFFFLKKFCADVLFSPSLIFPLNPPTPLHHPTPPLLFFSPSPADVKAFVSHQMSWPFLSSG